jgi:PPM family protein phosphatase
MANKKLKNFEFANHTEKGKLYKENTDEVVFFECANGSIFLICQDNGELGLETSPAKLAAQRIQYYLENEYVANPVNALYNALIYTNGFIYEYGRKNDKYKGAQVHCACILIRDNMAYYSTFGEIAIYFFNGKRLHLLSQGNKRSTPVSQPISDNLETSDDTSNPNFLLGKSRDINPDVNTEALVPLNEDMVLLCSRGFFESVSEKNISKILYDPMPVQTKVYRFVDMANIAGGEENISIQLISFYNIDHAERKFKPLDVRKSIPVKRQVRNNKTEVPTGVDEKSKLQQLSERYLTGPVKIALLILGALLFAYMVYDLFIHDPMPPVKSSDRNVIVNDTTSAIVIEKLDAEPVETVSSKKLPADQSYLVKAGDTWGRIYTQFGVCSWFIRNHESNKGKFDADDNPIAGSRLQIPIVYSARRDLNPDFYQEFSLQKTGSRCENANQEFIDRFKASNL